MVPHPHDLQRRPGGLHLLQQLPHHLLGVFYGIAPRELVGLYEDISVGVEDDGLSRRRPSVQPEKSLDDLTRLKGGGNKFLRLEALLESLELLVALAEAGASGFGFLFDPAVGDVGLELRCSAVDAYVVILGLAVLHRPDGGEILSVVRHLDEAFGFHALGEGVVPLLPDLGDIVLPGLQHAADVTVGPAQEQDLGAEGVAAREHG
jgi:hypothetical protein